MRLSVINLDPYDVLPLSKLRIEYPNLYATIKKRLPNLDLLDIAAMMNIAINICGACRDEPFGCQCWNDE